MSAVERSTGKWLKDGISGAGPKIGEPKNREGGLEYGKERMIHYRKTDRCWWVENPTMCVSGQKRLSGKKWESFSVTVFPPLFALRSAVWLSIPLFAQKNARALSGGSAQKEKLRNRRLNICRPIDDSLYDTNAETENLIHKEHENKSWRQKQKEKID
jgi:hypothetical protein